ncbi:calcium/sodium antiporter [Alteriqipengyuania sp. WL0013]|uniref:calcium/sodium antiporter n=1 Tax=Alteriqipengyuania sp. WL0013 TaxID=3110773 RepID=UPI002C22E2FF|nr:calcium/sodium antiporter [Alteriqipengyuania sp. WL0013]MEB3415449.1 calcium/sodium antiporter [Alteriqipengyuania sp. WL0013]
MLTSILILLAGLVALTIGGELLVRGAVSLAEIFGLSALVTGVVIVGAATSMPELVASIQAALAGSPGIAWGNIVGSNIANTLLILGAVAVFAPFSLSGGGKRDAVVGLLAAVLLGGLAWFGLAATWLGIVLVALLVIYIVWRLGHPRMPTAENEEEEEELGGYRLPAASALFAVGVGLLVLGGSWLVSGAVDLARLAGVSEVAIGATVVAIGTSLPELAASVAAALRGQPGLAFGNVVGSNVFNALLIGGVTMAVAPMPIPVELLDIEWPVLIASAALLVLLAGKIKRIGRGVGAGMLAVFAAYSALAFT